MLAAELGSVRLVMRGPEDDGAQVGRGITSRELFGKPESGQLEKDQAPPDQGKPTASADFLEMLKASTQSTPAATEEPKMTEGPEAPAAPSRYRMTLLLGTKRGEAVFEPRGKDATAESWKLITEDGAGDVAQVPAVSPIPPAAEQPGRGEEGKGLPKPNRGTNKPAGKEAKPSPAGPKDRPPTKTS
jgi:hypothetical protein